MKALYLIDSENVGDFWIPLLDLPDEETELVVFYTKNSPHMSYDSLIKLKLSDKVVTFIKCYEGTNALDFQLVSELGYRMKGNEEGEFIIVTNDTGYDAAVKYWRKKGYSVRRITGKECKNASRSRSASRSRQQASAPERHAHAGRQSEEPVKSVPAVSAEEISSQEPETVAVSAEPAVASAEPVVASAEAAVPEESAVQEKVTESANEPAEEVKEIPAAEETAPEPEAEQPEEETNRNAPVAEKKVWNGTGFSVVGSPVAAEQESEDKKPEAVSVLQEEPVPEEPQPAPEKPEESQPVPEKPEEPQPEPEKPEEPQSEPEKPQPENEEKTAPVPEAKAVATVKSGKAEKRARKEDSGIVIDEGGVSSGEAELKDLTVIVSCVGMDNLAELHNQLIQFYGQGGKQIYQSIKNGSMQIQTADWTQHEKYARYGELIFRHHGEGEKCPDDFADFIEGAGKKRDNLNSFRYALLKRYGKEKGRRYYFLLKPFMKAINEM